MGDSIQFDHQLTPAALKLIEAVEAREARVARLAMLKAAGARAQAKLDQKRIEMEAARK